MEAAEHYEQWLETQAIANAESLARVEEGELHLPRRIPEEELQARWYAGELGWRFTTTAGAQVEIISSGRWNPQPGPVFTGACVSFNGGPEREGDIELRSDATSWGERAEPEYAKTLLHLFPGAGVASVGRPPLPSITHDGRTVPQIALDITALEFDKASALLPEPHPHIAPPFAAYSDEQITRLLEGAAQYRLLQKSSRIERLSAQTSPSEGLYQAVAETLGYRHNKLPFTLLAQRFPVAQLRRQIGEIEPMLFAASGFLASEFAGLPDDSRSYLREVWNRWWPRRSEVERLTLPSSLWVLRGARPVNHPQRRVAALAEVARNWPVIESLIRMGELRAIRSFFTELHHNYWDHHYTLSSRRAAQAMALIGEGRVHEILANVVFPVTIGSRSASAMSQWRLYLELPARSGNEKLTQATAALFTPAQQKMVNRLLKRVVYQQGLLQLTVAWPFCAPSS